MWKRFFLHKGFLQITFESEIFLLVFQTSFWFKRFRENKASEWFVISWTNCYMFFQIALLSKWLAANQAIERFVIFMNCSNMNIHSAFLSKWFAANQANGFSSPWTVLTWTIKPLLCPNDWLQNKHWNSLIPSCTVLTCLFKLFFSPKDLLQIKHFKSLIPSIPSLFGHVYSNQFLVQKISCNSSTRMGVHFHELFWYEYVNGFFDQMFACKSVCFSVCMYGHLFLITIFIPIRQFYYISYIAIGIKFHYRRTAM